MTICQFESPAEAGSPLWQAGRDRFLEAGRRAQTLTHPRILPVLDVIDEAGEALIASECVEGETLESALQSKRLSVDEAGAILGQVALALDFAHSRGVVHGDLKPAAIHLSPDGQVKVADFGVSPLAHWDTGRPVPLNRLHEFLSPEFIRDPASVDGRSDQYSLAVIAYWMFTGQSPYGQDGGDPAAAILGTEPAPPSRLDQRLPASFDGPILRALDRDPARRFESCRKFVAALGTESAPQSVVIAGRRTRPAIWIAAGLVPVLAVAGYLLLKGKSSQPAESKISEAAQADLVQQAAPPVIDRPAAHQTAIKPSPTDSSRPTPFGNPVADLPKLPQPPPEPKQPLLPVIVPTRQPPPPASSSSYDIQVFSRDKPLTEGQHFALLDPTYGEMAFGDLTAIVTGTNAANARDRLSIEWSVSAIKHDSGAVRLKEKSVYHNQPSPGAYEVTLTLNGRPIRHFSFSITP